MYSFGRRSRTFVALAIIVAFTTGGLLHSVIPHDHGTRVALSAQEDHCHRGDSAKESPLWGFVHASIAHLGKKVLAAPDCARLGSASALSAQALASTFTIVERRVSLRYEVLLARGVFAFRKFG